MAVSVPIAAAVITTVGTGVAQHHAQKKQARATDQANAQINQERQKQAEAQTVRDSQAEQRRRRLMQLAGADLANRSTLGGSAGGVAGGTSGKSKLGL
jgi:negative regulator of sigma E activity